jgi:hypothetical protein
MRRYGRAMPLEVVGAGLGRTGTNSLKLALERLLGGRCYHMFEAIERPDDTVVWHAAVRGERVDWASFLREYVAAVDWPACAFWSELLEANPGAHVLLSTRDSAEKWWESMEETIVATVTSPVPPGEPDLAARRAMIRDLMTRRFDPGWTGRDAAIAAYERHNSAVRRAVPAERLIDWRPGDGWEPICEALGIEVPDEAFPHVNTAAEFKAGQDEDAAP